MVADPTTVAIVDTKAIVLDPALDKLQNACMDSANQYIKQLLNNLVSAFVVFVVLMSMGMVVLYLLGFDRMKRSMLDTNIVIRILPFETLEKDTQEKIKDFVKA